ncbi:phage tail domain-containing protein [Bacillus sp. MRMR6]|uniref:phage tail domain-containing protein n=1 Tax=Bacillus sp. MRMR6 TaxID=1928617 RepID=UPI000951E17B|nr:phage tail domain-containing protein [Bacillus sp. MRMR6]OLS39144.1 hypothetical protein BTR25_13510 [Bacillus sp. MRMR6]
MNLVIERKNGEQIDFEESGIKTLDFVIDAPEPIHETEVIEGADGLIDLGTTYGPRKMRGSFYYEAESISEYALKRNEAFRLFLTRESVYLIDSREPEKRWLVKSSGFSPKQVNKYGFFEVEFGSFLPWAESIETTLEMSVAQISGNKIQKYKHATSTFEIFNAGSQAVNPRRMLLLITYKGTSTNLAIKNLTTSDEWNFTGTTTTNDTIILDGIRATKNGLSIFRDSNRKLINIAPGWNEFQLVGAAGTFEISFEFRFYTL